MRIRTLHRPVVRGPRILVKRNEPFLSFILSMTACYTLTHNYRQRKRRKERRGGEEGKELRRGEKRKGEGEGAVEEERMHKALFKH